MTMKKENMIFVIKLQNKLKCKIVLIDKLRGTIKLSHVDYRLQFMIIIIH